MNTRHATRRRVTKETSVDVTLEIQSPIWAEFDRIEIYVNSATTKSVAQRQSGVGLVDVTTYAVSPDYVLTAGVAPPLPDLRR